MFQLMLIYINVPSTLTPCFFLNQIYLTYSSINSSYVEDKNSDAEGGECAAAPPADRQWHFWLQCLYHILTLEYLLNSFTFNFPLHTPNNKYNKYVVLMKEAH